MSANGGVAEGDKAKLEPRYWTMLQHLVSPCFTVFPTVGYGDLLYAAGHLTALWVAGL